MKITPSIIHDLLSKGGIPVACVRFGDWEDKTTWLIDFDASATDQQKSAAQAIIDAFDLSAEAALRDKLALYKKKAALRQARALANEDGETEVVNRLDTEFNEA